MHDHGKIRVWSGGKFMSLVIHLYYKGNNGSAAAFAKEMEESGIADAIRKEPGNERYAYYQSLGDPEEVLLIDAWKDQKALDEHHASEMMKKLAALREKYDLHMRSERYVLDETELPASEQAFLRK